MDIDNQDWIEKLYDRVFIQFKGDEHLSHFPLCEIVDGHIRMVTQSFIKIRTTENKLVVYDMPTFVSTLNEELAPEKEILGGWLLHAGQVYRVRDAQVTQKE